MPKPEETATPWEKRPRFAMTLKLKNPTAPEIGVYGGRLAVKEIPQKSNVRWQKKLSLKFRAILKTKSFKEELATFFSLTGQPYRRW